MRLPERVLVATGPLDLRASFDRLAGAVRERLSEEPSAGTLFVFHNRARTHLKMLWVDGTGACIFYKRLARGTYRIPVASPEGASRVQVSARELALLLEGIDERTLRAARRALRAER